MGGLFPDRRRTATLQFGRLLHPPLPLDAALEHAEETPHASLVLRGQAATWR